MEEAEVARQQIEEDARKFFAFTGAQKPAANAIFILIMGITGAGKSNFVASCTGKQVTVGHKLHSCKYIRISYLAHRINQTYYQPYKCPVYRHVRY